MATILEGSDTRTKAEVFCVPSDYPYIETESGEKLGDGHYWWYIMESGCPDSYPSGPFENSISAIADWEMAGSQEPDCEEE